MKPVKKVWKITRWLLAMAILLLWAGAFSGFLPLLAKLMGGTQLIPALLGGSAGLAILLLLTFFCGRFYCSVLCPFGIIQDLLAWPFKRKKGYDIPDFRKVRLLVCGLLLGMWCGGSAVGFMWLDPYSNSGRIAGIFWICGAVTLAVLLILSVWKPRWFCNMFCPAGTLLGAASRFGVYQLQLNDRCVKCVACVKNCPAGCIDLNKKVIDNERCLRCMNCLAVCPAAAIEWGSGKPDGFSRREFLINSGVFAAGCAAGFGILKTPAVSALAAPAKTPILPPGAGDAAVFAARCTGCQLCVKQCPAQIIVPASDKMPGTVSLDLDRAACRFDCNICSQVCPAGAIKSLSMAEKQRTQIAVASFNPRNCMVFQMEEPCGECAKACPTGAIVLRANGTPRPVNKALCVGCGACQQVCPMRRKAMTVKAIEKQTLITGGVKI